MLRMAQAREEAEAARARSQQVGPLHRLAQPMGFDLHQAPPASLRC